MKESSVARTFLCALIALRGGASALYGVFLEEHIVMTEV
jgi:hypothetical protein